MIIVWTVSFSFNLKLLFGGGFSKRVLRSVSERLLSVIYKNSLIALKFKGLSRLVVNVSIPRLAGDSPYHIKLFKAGNNSIFLEVCMNDDYSISVSLPDFIVSGDGEVSSVYGCVILVFKRSSNGISIHLGGD